MFCSNCGSKLSDGARFCSVCGNRLSEQSVEEARTFGEFKFDEPERSYEPAVDASKVIDEFAEMPKRERVSFDWSNVLDEPRKKEIPDIKSPWSTTTGIDEKELYAEMTPSTDKSRTMSFIDVLRAEKEEKEKKAAEKAIEYTQVLDLDQDLSAFDEPPKLHYAPLYEDVDEPVRTPFDDFRKPAEPVFKGEQRFERPEPAPQPSKKEPEITASRDTIAMFDDYVRSFEQGAGITAAKPAYERPQREAHKFDLPDFLKKADDKKDAAAPAAAAEPESEAPAAPVFKFNTAEMAPPTANSSFEPIYEGPAYEPEFEEPVFEEPIYEEPVFEEPKYDGGDLTDYLDDFDDGEDADEGGMENMYLGLDYNKNKKEMPEQPGREEPVYRQPAYQSPSYEEPVYEPVDEAELFREMNESKPKKTGMTIAAPADKESEIEALKSRLAELMGNEQPAEEPVPEGAVSLEELSKAEFTFEPVAGNEVNELFDGIAQDYVEPGPGTEPAPEDIYSDIELPQHASSVTPADPALTLNVQTAPEAPVYEPAPAAPVYAEPAPAAPVYEPAPAAPVYAEPVPATPVYEPAPAAPVYAEPAPEAPVYEPAPAAPVYAEPVPAAPVYEAAPAEVSVESIYLDYNYSEPAAEARHAAPAAPVYAEPVTSAPAYEPAPAVYAEPAPAAPEFTTMPAVEPEPVILEEIPAAPAYAEPAPAAPVYEAVPAAPVYEAAPAPVVEMTPAASVYAAPEMTVPEAEKEKSSDAMSLEDIEKDLFGEVPAEAVEAEETKKIDKFYTLYRKNEEFQRLLDEEYDKLRGEDAPAVKEEPAAAPAAEPAPVKEVAAENSKAYRQIEDETIYQAFEIPDELLPADESKAPVEAPKEVRPLVEADSGVTSYKRESKKAAKAAAKAEKARKKEEKRLAKAEKAAPVEMPDSDVEYEDVDSGSGFLTVLAVIIAVILVILLAVILVLQVAPDSGIAIAIDSLIEKLTGGLSAIDPGSGQFLL